MLTIVADHFWACWSLVVFAIGVGALTIETVAREIGSRR